MMAIIKKLAIIDELIQLYNRRYFFSRLAEEGDWAYRYKQPISCLLLDIDTLVRRVDQALYRAKKLGRNRVEAYT